MRCLDNLILNGKAKTKTRAYSLRLELGWFDFILTMILTKYALNVMLATTMLLQGKEMEIASGVHVIESLLGNIKTMREKCDETMKCFMKKQNQLLLVFIFLNPNLHNRDSVPNCSISDYYKVRVTIPLLEHLIFNSRGRI